MNGVKNAKKFKSKKKKRKKKLPWNYCKATLLTLSVDLLFCLIVWKPIVQTLKSFGMADFVLSFNSRGKFVRWHLVFSIFSLLIKFTLVEIRNHNYYRNNVLTIFSSGLKTFKLITWKPLIYCHFLLSSCDNHNSDSIPLVQKHSPEVFCKKTCS